MANILYRISTSPTVPGSTTVSAGDAPLTSAEIDGNLKSLDNDLATRAYLSGDTFTGTVTSANDSFGATSQDYPTIRPTLDLDFAGQEVLDSRVQFLRSSTATRVNNKGLIETVGANTPRFNYDPVSMVCKGLLIEGGVTNLQSPSLPDSTYTTTGTAIRTYYNAVAPDGTLTATKITCATQDGIYKNVTVTSGQTYTHSVFVKAGTNTNTYLRDDNGVGRHIVINPATGVVTGTSGTISNYGSQSFGNGWFRYWFTFVADTTQARCLVRSEQAGTTDFWVWGFQIENQAHMSSYMPSAETFTGRSSTGTFIGSNGLIQTAASGVARYSYNPLNLSVSPALLLEAAATNLLVWSEEFDNVGWGLTNASVTANATTAPDGTLTADKLIDNTTNAAHLVGNSSSGISASTTYTQSVYIKAAELSKGRLRYATNIGFLAESVFDLSAGTATGTGAGIANVGNGWYRVSTTATTQASATSIQLQIYLRDGASDTYVGTGTSGLFIWGAQLEAGSYPTSYIPTTTAQVTRAADTYTTASGVRTADSVTVDGNYFFHFNNFYKQGVGTIVAEWDSNGSPTTTSAGVFQLGTSSSNRIAHQRASNLNRITISTTGYGSQTLIDYASATLTFPMTTQNKFAVAFATNDISISSNGAAVSTDTSCILPTVTTLRIGFGISNYIEGHVKSFTYYPARLPDAQLRALSSL